LCSPLAPVSFFFFLQPALFFLPSRTRFAKGRGGKDSVDHLLAAAEALSAAASEA